MKFSKNKISKVFFWVLVSVTSIVVLVIVFISPLTKWAIEKYDLKYSGREITVDLAYVNPFTGYVYFKNLKIYEANSDSIFFSSNISADFNMIKLFSKTYEISSVTLNKPVGRVLQTKKDFNFSDLIKKFVPKDSVAKNKTTGPIHLNIRNIKIENGTFYYIENTIPVFYFVKDVNIETAGKLWDSDNMTFKYNMISGIGTGDLKGTLDLNTVTTDYRISATVNDFELGVLEQYVRDIANYGRVRGKLDADVRASGNFKDAQNLNAKGFLAIRDFHIGKSIHEDYAAFKNLYVQIIQLSPKAKKYFFDSVSIVEPYFKYERYDHLDNLQYMFNKRGESSGSSDKGQASANILIQIGRYVELLAKNFFKSDYQLRRLAIYNGTLKYNDFSLTEKFSAAFSPINLVADSIQRGEEWVKLKLHAGLKPYGTMGLDIRINPRDSSDFDLNFYLKKIPLALFNPFLITYTSFPVDRGTLELNCNWTVRNGNISSRNNLLVIDPRVNNRQRRNGARWLPLRFFMFFIRERGNAIDYEIPIKGNLKDPKFKFKDVIFDALTNIFLKPVTVNYRSQVKQVENEVEKTISLKWMMRSIEFNNPYEKFVQKIVDFLKDNPNEIISVRPIFYAEKEKEYILFFEAKKLFFLETHNIKANAMTEKDSTAIEKISVKGASFTAYLNKKASKDIHTVQEKCYAFVDRRLIEKRFGQLVAAREARFKSYFKDNKLIKRVKMLSVREKIPFNGFSLYNLGFNGKLPEDLVNAYHKLEDFDNKDPRKKFKKQRRRDRRQLDIK